MPSTKGRMVRYTVEPPRKSYARQPDDDVRSRRDPNVQAAPADSHALLLMAAKRRPSRRRQANQRRRNSIHATALFFAELEGFTFRGRGEIFVSGSEMLGASSS
jgi:hypothetical protein